MNKSSSKHYDFLDGLRGIAVLWVMAHHFLYGFNARSVFIQGVIFFKTHDLDWAARLCAVAFDHVYVKLTFFGNYGVDMFFVISGFLITGLLIGFIDHKADIKRFYVRRFFKIIPHYYFIVIISIIGVVIFAHIPAQEALKQTGILFLFQQNYQPVSDVFSHTWSLVVEEQFYIFWGLTLWALSLNAMRPSQRFFGAVAISCAMILLINMHRIYFYDHGQTFFEAARGPVHHTQMFWLRADGLMGGCLLRLFLPFIETLRSRAWIFYVLGLLLYIVLLAAPAIPAQYGVPARWWDLTLAWLAPACLIIAGINRRSFVSSFKPLQLIGKNSYGIYLVHLLLLKIFEFEAAQQQNYALIFGVVFVLTSICAGIITTYCVEKQFLRLRERIAP